MSFATDLKTLMNADSALNALVSAINFINAADNKDLTSEYIIYNYEKIDDISSFDGYNEMLIYKLDIFIFSDDTEDADDILEAVTAYLDNYEDSNFKDVMYQSDERGVEGEKEQYLAQLEYRIIYKN